MSGTQQERLSAYLDGELDPLERAALERELDASEELRQAPAELAALDEAAREIPVEAPEGYFEALPGRVRARLAGERPAGLRLPAWGWAAAAAVAVAAIAPLMLTRLDTAAPPRARAAARPAEAPALADQVAPVARSEPEVPAAAEPAASAAAAPSSLERVAGGRGAGDAPAPAATPAPSALPRARFAAPPPVRPQAAAEPAPARQPVAEEALEEDAARDAVAGLRSPAREERAGTAGGAANEQAKAVAPPPPAAAPAPATLGFAVGADAEAFTALASRQVRDADEARALRQAWRDLARTHPDSPLADEARVRAIEAGVEAFRLGGAEEDRERARADVEAYLARADAAQEGRVRALLTALSR